jgi:hypothetical protein
LALSRPIDTFVLHLLLSTDRAFLNLPPALRQGRSNSLLSVLRALLKGQNKPMWSALFTNLKEKIEFLTFSVSLPDREITSKVRVSLCVCEPPALASITHSTKYKFHLTIYYYFRKNIFNFNIFLANKNCI